jgi:hypothetical protein
MPLHDWQERPDWDGVHRRWITELLRWLGPRLPVGYRAYLGSAPPLTVTAHTELPDPGGESADANATTDARAAAPGFLEPDEEVAVTALQPDVAVMVARDDELVAIVEVMSPRNKERPLVRTTCLARCLGYLLRGVNLLMVDLHRRPLAFSFADRIAAELQVPQPSCPPPMAVVYRVGAAMADGGRALAMWRRQLVVGEPLPALPLPLAADVAVAVDLEATYRPAAGVYSA